LQSKEAPYSISISTVKLACLSHKGYSQKSLCLGWEKLLHKPEPCSRARPAPTSKLDTFGVGAGRARDVNPEVLHLLGCRRAQRGEISQHPEISPFGRDDTPSAMRFCG